MDRIGFENLQFLLPSPIYEWWNIQRARNTFVGIYIVRGLCKIGFVLKNLKLLRKWADPPDVYEISRSGDAIKSWREQRTAMMEEGRYVVIQTVFDLNLSVVKIISAYYPYLWSKTSGSSSTSRAIWFAVFDFIVSEIGQLIASSITDIIHDETDNSNYLLTELIYLVPQMMSRIIVIYITAHFLDLLGLKIVLFEVVLYKIVSFIFLRPFKALPRDNIKSALEARLPGAAEIIDLARGMMYPIDNLLIDHGGSRPPKATHHYYVFMDRIVITKNLLITMDPTQSTGIVAHELYRWKHGHALIDGVCRLMVNILKAWVFSVAYKNPKVAEFFHLESTHPVVPLLLVHSLVWPVINDVIYSVGHVFCAHRELRADDFACEVTNPKKYREALVKLAPYREFHPFDSWYSMIFHGMPSLNHRIQRVNRMMQKF